LRIKAKNGEVYDLAVLRANLQDGVPWASAIVDALEAIFSIPRKRSSYDRSTLTGGRGVADDAYNIAYNVALADVGRVGGLIEEP
jgi:hypothetical protein